MNSPLTTAHGSQLLEQSSIFACQHCYAPMNYVTLPGGETALECNSERCGWTCTLGAAEACVIQDDLVSVGLAVEQAKHLCRACGGAHHIQVCPSILNELHKNEPREIELANGRGVALVDAEDYEMLCRFSWHLHSQGYATARIGSATVYMHHFIIKIPNGHVTDHANGNKLDNRRSNLRTASKRQNAYNSKMRTGTLSPYRGVTRDVKRNGKWQANIRINGKRIHLGYFENDIDAARAYDRAAYEHHGEFAKLNFPNDFAKAA